MGRRGPALGTGAGRVRGCWLTLTHTVEDEDSAYAHGADWHAGFEVLEAQLEGRDVNWSPWERARELADKYRNPSD